MRGTRAYVWKGLGWGLALAATVGLVRQVSIAQAFASVRGVGFAFLWLLLPYALATTLYALPWGLLLGRRSRPSWSAVIGTRFAAAAVNVVLPSGVFGEPVRLRAVPPGRRAQAGEALVWDRAFYLAASGVFAALVARAGACRQAFGRASWGAALGFVAGAVGLAATLRFEPLRRRWRPHEARAASDRPPALPVAFVSVACHFAARLLVAVEVWLGAALLGIHLGLEEWLFAAGAVVLAAAAMPIVPGQLGVQEASLAAAFAAMGHDAAAGLSLGLLLRLRQLVFVPIGLGLALRRWRPDDSERASSAPA